MPLPKKIIVEDYSPQWALNFQKLKSIYKTNLGDLALDIQHVGSTSVVGLAAKPVLDIDVIIENREILNDVIPRLEKIGYQHIGDLGVIDREAFKRRPGNIISDDIDSILQKHNLYVCIKDSFHLKSHLQFRDYLRKNPEKAKQYGELKKRLAKENPFDIDIYIEKKTPFIVGALKETAFDDESLEYLIELNRAKK